MTVVLMSSLTRISDLKSHPYEYSKLDRGHWATGDYVAAEVRGNPRRSYGIELASGRVVEAMHGDHVIGAFGDRAATLEVVGSWAAMEGDYIDAMTSAGLFGAVTSVSQLIGSLLQLKYLGHVVRNGQKVCMTDFAIGTQGGSFNVPTIMLAGTSMSAGKTLTGRLIVHELEKMGHSVVGAKLTGAGRYRDVLSFRDAGASEIFDFVDAGLPSTIVPENIFRQAIRPLLHHIDQLNPDFLVAEAGASPLEPYNGAAAIDELGDNICCMVLCASDPYAVVGVEKAFGLKPDLVAGPAAATTAATDLVQKLSGVSALNVLDPSCPAKMRDFLSAKLQL